MQLPRWTAPYCDPDVLRCEVIAMQSAMREALLAELPDGTIRALYAKGSATKPWTTPIDYVPEVSDVDVHLLVRDPHNWVDLPQALEVADDMERRFRAACPEPLHFPRPQLVLLNPLLESEDYTPSPPETVTTLYGEPYANGDAHAIDSDAVLRQDARSLLSEREHIAALPGRLIDRPGRFVWDILRWIVFRVSPSVPRVLDLLGLDPDHVWRLNRTQLVEALLVQNQGVLAATYVAYYETCWRISCPIGRTSPPVATRCFAAWKSSSWVSALPRTGWRGVRAPSSRGGVAQHVGGVNCRSVERT